jgi:hypothetical protein
MGEVAEILNIQVRKGLKEKVTVGTRSQGGEASE